ncbi:hypothetical protein E2C01_068820 [Portunus trituberculatus]|uniref:Uncharacterized protein n=1 Tax=Portunus trituberculatus TaxID=210409 RepID=A0A5B7HT17_PORTR|nr:hypothetical protein [Portunus trituberculatus]
MTRAAAQQRGSLAASLRACTERACIFLHQCSSPPTAQRCKLPPNVLPRRGKETEGLEGEARHVKRGVAAKGTEDAGSYLVPSHTPPGPLRHHHHHHPPANRTKKRCQGATLTSPIHPHTNSPTPPPPPG